MEKLMKKFIAVLLIIAAMVCSGTTACSFQHDRERDGLLPNTSQTYSENTQGVSLEMLQEAAENYVFSLPEYDGSEVVTLNGGIPCFFADEITDSEEITFSELDELGRCGAAFGCLGKDTLPTEERGRIGMVKPSGWHTVKYDCVEGKYLFNRCHLIAYELCGANAEERNLITGTRYMNISGMLETENAVCSYIKKSGNHVCYRVTPRFVGEELVARGVQIEAYSVEDFGVGVCLNIFCFNIQPEIVIDYLTGESYAEGEESADIPSVSASDAGNADESAEYFVPSRSTTYVINTKTGKFHRPECESVQDMKANNREESSGTREELLEQGYQPCGRCKP